MDPPLACDACGGDDEDCDACEGRGFAMVRSCPRKIVPPAVWEAMRFRSMTRKGWGMPEGDKLYDQPDMLLRMYEMIDAEDAQIQAEESKGKPANG